MDLPICFWRTHGTCLFSQWLQLISNAIFHAIGWVLENMDNLINVEVFDMAELVKTSSQKADPIPFYQVGHHNYCFVQTVAWNAALAASYDVEEMLEVALVLKLQGEHHGGDNKVFQIANIQ